MNSPKQNKQYKFILFPTHRSPRVSLTMISMALGNNISRELTSVMKDRLSAYSVLRNSSYFFFLAKTILIWKPSTSVPLHSDIAFSAVAMSLNSTKQCLQIQHDTNERYNVFSYLVGKCTLVIEHIATRGVWESVNAQILRTNQLTSTPTHH